MVGSQFYGHNLLIPKVAIKCQTVFASDFRLIHIQDHHYSVCCNIFRNAQWVKKCGRQDSMDDNLLYLNKSYVLCEEHFMDCQYMNPGDRKSGLMPSSVPVLFNLPDQQNVSRDEAVEDNNTYHMKSGKK